jgi:hypothetical protein
MIRGLRHAHACPRGRGSAYVHEPVERNGSTNQHVRIDTIDRAIDYIGPVKLTYSFHDPKNFKIPCMALCSNFSALYDVTFGP